MLTAARLFSWSLSANWDCNGQLLDRWGKPFRVSVAFFYENTNRRQPELIARNQPLPPSGILTAAPDFPLPPPLHNKLGLITPTTHYSLSKISATLHFNRSQIDSKVPAVTLSATRQPTSMIRPAGSWVPATHWARFRRTTMTRPLNNSSLNRHSFHLSSLPVSVSSGTSVVKSRRLRFLCPLIRVKFVCIGG